jgi:ABC-type Fe3+-hydroxamate transport system substrate-binding protein
MSAPTTVRDDRGKVFRPRPDAPPPRVVSLVPSDTYSLFRLGAGPLLVGRTRYCVAPEGDVDAIEIVGGTKDADVDRIVDLQPHVVIANQEESSQRDVERLEAMGLRVFVSFPRTVAAGVNHLARLALLLGGEARLPGSRAVVRDAYAKLRAAEARRAAAPRRRAFVPIWMDPLMTANGDTFLSDALSLAGADNVFADRERRYPLSADLGAAAPLSPDRVTGRDVRYPRITTAEIVARAPDLVLLPDEPHAFSEADAEVFRGLDIPAARRGAVVLCDGKDLLWYGARSVEYMETLASTIASAGA